uniref:AAA+ ATPase domain-containing protein n=1 Tax=Plectus sambesii TaxID=2011161 RepID=A0A914UW88_9BILA
MNVVIEGSIGEMNRQLLITGPPGIGKTTLIRKVYERLAASGCRLTGFYTAEQRDARGYRVGFEVVKCPEDGTRARLASVEGNGPRVGKYAVDIASFDRVALACLDDLTVEVIVLDEIGKMESLSKGFVAAVDRLLQTANRPLLLATVPVSKGRALPLVQRVLAVDGSRLLEVTKENREQLVDEVFASIRAMQSQSAG